eukprot:5540280-Pleurochrysis_carterae.AAC.1
MQSASSRLAAGTQRCFKNIRWTIFIQQLFTLSLIVGAGLCNPLTIMRLRVLRRYLKVWQAQIP